MSKTDPNLSKELKRLQDSTGQLPETVTAKTRGQLAADQAEEAAFIPPHSSTSREPISSGSDAVYERPVFEPEETEDSATEAEASEQEQNPPPPQAGAEALSETSDGSDHDSEEESSDHGGGAPGGGRGGDGGAGGGNDDGNRDQRGNGETTDEEEENNMANLEVILEEVTKDGKAWKETVEALDEDSLKKVESLLTIRKSSADDVSDCVTKIKALNAKVTLTDVDAQILKDKVETLEALKIKVRKRHICS